jgi:glyoxylate/hydroxypyruvate reductase A
MTPADPVVLMLLTSEFVVARHQALREMAPQIQVVTDPAACDAARIDAIFAFKLPNGLAGGLPNLRLVASVGAGADGLLSAADLPPSVAVTRVVEPGLGFSMAQYVAYQVLRPFRQFAQLEAQQREGRWARLPIPDARAHTVGLMGLGAIGRQVAAALAALGFKVVGWTRSGRSVDGVERVYGGAQGLQEFLSGVDTLVCLLPFTADTRGLLNAELLGRLRPGAFVVNAARGGIVDETALLDLVARGHLRGAALDVFETEPLPAAHPLWRQPGLVVTPHIAAQPSVQGAVRQFVDNLQRLRDGRALLHTVDRDSGY